jgi:hypothetical protein
MHHFPACYWLGPKGFAYSGRYYIMQAHITQLMHNKTCLAMQPWNIAAAETIDASKTTASNTPPAMHQIRCKQTRVNQVHEICCTTMIKNLNMCMPPAHRKGHGQKILLCRSIAGSQHLITS